MNIVDSKIFINKDEELALEDAGQGESEIYKLEGSKMNLYGHAWTDGYFLIFFDDEKMSTMQKFIYYMGAENEAELVTRYSGVSIWQNISESRLTRGREEDKNGEDVVYQIISEEDDEDEDDDNGEEKIAGC